MNSFSVIDVDDKKWSEFISQSKQYDFYHTQCYHLLEKEGKPLLFLCRMDGDFIALPLILRRIEGTNYWDCTSVYGYAGPVSNLDFKKVPDKMFAYFRFQLNQYFKESRIVSVFSRLHPIIIGDELFSNFGLIKNVNLTVAMDLSLAPEEQKKQYRKSNKSEINQLRGKKNFQIQEIISERGIRSFTSIYQETMKKVGASQKYFFNFDYFNNFLNNKCFSSKLITAIKDGEITAGAIFTITHTIMQYHLAGTKEEYIRDTPMKLILDTARLLGNELGLDYLHLGGGVGGSDEDSLFRFKAGFSERRFMFRVWQYIVDQDLYTELCKMKIANREVNKSYFPLYRVI